MMPSAPGPELGTDSAGPLPSGCQLCSDSSHLNPYRPHSPSGVPALCLHFLTNHSHHRPPQAATVTSPPLQPLSSRSLRSPSCPVPWPFFQLLYFLPNYTHSLSYSIQSRGFKYDLYTDLSLSSKLIVPTAYSTPLLGCLMNILESTCAKH